MNTAAAGDFVDIGLVDILTARSTTV